MDQELPHFDYHPDPLLTGMVVQREIDCVCCGERRPHAYVGPVYTARRDADERLCPWCIKSGRAARELEGFFMDDRILTRAGLPQAIVDEVSQRTPGFRSWQGLTWLCHCDDAAAFVGDATLEDLKGMAPSEQLWLLQQSGLAPEEWLEIVACYVPRGDPSVTSSGAATAASASSRSTADEALPY